MKVIFLDFDGVLNSEASFRMEVRRKNSRVSDSLSTVACSNLQYILDQDSDIRIVISSTWRKIHTLMELKNILDSYGVKANIIGKTPVSFSGHRGREITSWLEDNPQVTKFVVLDDDGDAGAAVLDDKRGHFFQTSWEDGLLNKQAKSIAKLFRDEPVTYKEKK